MKVKDLERVVAKLMLRGKGDLELIYTDTRNGDTGSVSIYNSTDRVDEGNEMGILCTMDRGTEYIPVYTGH